MLRLHKAGQTDQVIACLEGALVMGQSQPWMYTVLALAMEKAGRPREDVERVLLSGVDFSAVNVANLLYSAAFLTRFGAKDRALELYRQASRVDPARLEPYVLGLKLARERHDPEAVEWAAFGILTRAWNKDHVALHRDAESTANDLIAELRDRGEHPSAERLERALNEARQRDLVIELSWSGKADLDLLVEEPSGAVCSSDNTPTTGGGVFVHDGLGGDQKDTFDRYVCPRGLPGEYRAIVRHVRGDVVGKRALLKITRYQGTPYELEETFTVPLGEDDKSVRFSLEQGRLAALGELPLLKEAPAPRTIARRREVPGRHGPETQRAGADLMRMRQRRPGDQEPGYQPVISVLSEGATLSALAVVSGDRRYVRLTLAPVFSTITDVFTFSFINSGNPNGGGGTGTQQPGAGGQR